MNSLIRTKLAKRIKELRRRRGLTQNKFSEITEMDVKYLQRIEGKNPPNIRVETIERLAKALKITPSKLLDF
jgi:transcriptional regulator with XRE-family HTH domain